MIVSNKFKFIFIRVPKTGSSSITRCLRDFEILNNGIFEYRHDSYDFVNDEELQFFNNLRQDNPDLILTPNHSECAGCEKIIEPDVCKNYFKFSFVRNPWSRILSRYEWGRQLVNDMTDSSIFKSFKNYLKHIDEDDFRAFVQPQYDYTIGCNFIGKCENLQDDFNIICDKIGIPQKELPHKNATKHKHYTEYYDDETKEIVAEKYAKDIEYFGYEFGK
jgi:hypothetical protein